MGRGFEPLRGHKNVVTDVIASFCYMKKGLSLRIRAKDKIQIVGRLMVSRLDISPFGCRKVITTLKVFVKVVYL